MNKINKLTQIIKDELDYQEHDYYTRCFQKRSNGAVTLMKRQHIDSLTRLYKEAKKLQMSRYYDKQLNQK